MFHRKTDTKSKPQDLKPDFIAKLLTLFSHSTERGSALPMAVGLGVVMLGVTGVALMNSGRNKTDVASDEMTKQAVAAAEAGVGRIQNLFVQEPRLAMVSNKSEWTNIANSATSQEDLEEALNEVLPEDAENATSYSCDGSGGTGGGTSSLTHTELKNKLQGGVVKIPSTGVSVDPGVNDWVSLGNGTDYRLVNYINNAGNANLVIQGRVNGSSISEVAVDFPAQLASTGGMQPADNTEGVPALWTTDQGNDWKNDKVNGNIKIYSPDCKKLANISGSPDDDNLSNPTKHKITVSAEPMPDTPPLPDASVLQVVRGSVAGLTFPRSTPAVAAQDEVPATAGGTVCVEWKGNGDCKKTEYKPPTPYIPAIPAVPAKAPTPDANGYYHYLIESLEVSGGSDINIEEGKKVIFYVQGDIEFSGSPSLNGATANNGTNLQIYGNTIDSDGNSKYGCNSSGKCQTSKAHFNGTGLIQAFIHAPQAIGSVNGGGSASSKNIGGVQTESNFNGAMWIKAWDSSSGNSKVKLDGIGTYGDYISGAGRKVPGEPQITLGNVTNWRRQAKTAN